MPITFIANREVRSIPKGWKHPKDARGQFRPLLPRDDWSRTEEGRRDLAESGFPIPGEDAYMPDVEEQAEIAAYETTTEGTPISPTFPDTPEGKLALVNWCAANARTFADHGADAEAWAAILFGESLAGVDEGGRVSFA